MRAVIPAAGIGKRLRPHTLNIPKVMISVAGKPLIGHVIDSMESTGVTSVSLITGYKNELVEDYANQNYGHLRLDFPFQKERKGLGHAVLQGLEDKEEGVLIILGDTVFDVNYKAFVDRDENAIAVVKVDDPRRFGVAEVDAENRVERLVEKPEHPKSDLALAGLYFIKDQRILKRTLEEMIHKDIRTRGEYQLTDALQMMIEADHKIRAVEINGWYDCGTKESLLESQRFILDASSKMDHTESCTIYPPVFIHKDAIVKNSVIGPNVTIDEGSQVTDATLAETIVGKHSQLLKVSLEDTIIGDHCVIEGQVGSINVSDYSELKFD